MIRKVNKHFVFIISFAKRRRQASLLLPVFLVIKNLNKPLILNINFTM